MYVFVNRNTTHVNLWKVLSQVQINHVRLVVLIAATNTLMASEHEINVLANVMEIPIIIGKNL